MKKVFLQNPMQMEVASGRFNFVSVTLFYQEKILFTSFEGLSSFSFFSSYVSHFSFTSAIKASMISLILLSDKTSPRRDAGGITVPIAFSGSDLVSGFLMHTKILCLTGLLRWYMFLPPHKRSRSRKDKENCHFSISFHIKEEERSKRAAGSSAGAE